MADYRIDNITRNAATANIAWQNAQADADIPVAYDAHNIMIVATNSDAAAASLVFGTGANGSNSLKGTLTVSLAQNDVKVIALESERFTNSSGKINVLGTLAGGTLTNCKLQIIRAVDLA